MWRTVHRTLSLYSNCLAYLVRADTSEYDEALEVVEFLVPGIGQLGLVRRTVVVVQAPVRDVIHEILSAVYQQVLFYFTLCTYLSKHHESMLCSITAIINL